VASHECFIGGSRNGVHDQRGYDRERVVLDVIYILVTLAFFGLMLAYVRGCEMLGRESTGEEERK
jgi:hypothetical protein